MYRLNVLDDIVDHIIVVEANQTHSGKPKPLFFPEIKNDKVIKIVVDLPHPDLGQGITSEQVWENARYQRNCIEQGLEQLKLKNQDILIVSDLDEIPDPDTLKNIKINDIAQLEQDLYYYSLEYKLDHLWYLAKVMTFEYYISNNFTFSELRSKQFQSIPRGGWHLSYFGNAEFISNKIKNFAHQEYNNSEYTDLNKIKSRLEQGLDIYNRPIKLIKIPINENNYVPVRYLKN
jgi:beta-1,4-mannosyl-glycoprotein beta-1,4-N-acetylglucosaminyltransferase